MLNLSQTLARRINLQAFISGFFTSLSLILAIGAQNAFVLKQGIKKENIFIICLICAISDALLIFAGVFGLGSLVQNFSIIKQIALYGGFLFLLFYALKSFHACFFKDLSMDTSSDYARSNLKKNILLTLAFTWLNPHVYLDTMILIGSVSTKFKDENLIFGVGASLASFCFFLRTWLSG
ncbi:Transporter2C LysE family [Campylobacter concisus UNSWCD]|nr:Transporter2C LysE family [Campylobacter concisus UNSWCD]